MVFDKYKILKEQAAIPVVAHEGRLGDPVAAQEINQRATKERKHEEAAASERSHDSKLLSNQFVQNSGSLSKRDSREIFLAGSAQVTAVWDKMSHTSEVVGQFAPQHLAGASPHAPDPLRRGIKRRGTKDSDLNIRMTAEMRSQIEAKVAALETYPSAYVLELIAADLGLPTDDHRATRNKYLKKAFADLRIAFDDCGVNLNQMAKATNSGKPCPLTRPEINKALADFARGCRMLESLRP